MPVIDVHSHFHPPTLLAALRARGVVPRLVRAGDDEFVQYGADARYPIRPGMIDLGAKLEEMDANGIGKAILSVTMPGVDGCGADAPSVAREVNIELAELLEPHGDRLRWVAVLPMDNPRAAAAELRQAVADGARGAMIFSNVAGRPLDLELDGPVFAAACDLDVPLLVHPAYPLGATLFGGFEILSSIGYLVDTSVAVLRLILSGLFVDYAGLKLMICHAGSLLPYQAGRIDFQALNRPGGTGRLTQAPSEHIRRLYTDSICLSPATLRFAVAFFGADRVMFGTDHPQWPMAASVGTLKQAGLNGADRRAIEEETAAKLFRWANS